MATDSKERRAREIRGRGGFSLIELLMVVTVILVLTSIVAPSFQLSADRRVQNMAFEIVSELEMARARALAERQMVRVHFDVGGDQYTAFVDHDDDDAIGEVAAEVAAFPAFGVRELDDLVVFGRGSASNFPGDAVAGAVTLPSNRLEIDNQGVPTPWGTAGTIYLTHERDNSAVAAISVAASGAFKAWRWWPDDSEWR